MAGALVGLAAIVSMAVTGGGTLYAAVGGTGTTCTSGSPCPLTVALSSATSGDTVDLAPGTYEPASDTSFTIPTSITVQPTTPGSIVTLEGDGASVLGVNSSVTATLSGVSIEDGSALTDGGGISNSGTLTVEDSTISGNAAADAGGGISNSGTLTVEDSTISGNNAGGGGGISNSGTATIEASTITANSATTGYEGTFGGGINNSADSSMTLAADIIANQNSGGDCSNDVGTVTDAGYNVDDDGTCGLIASNNSIPDSTVIDDYLGTLGANGGPTETVPLLATPSPTTRSADPAFAVIPSTFDLPIAVKGVSLACSIPDQRGVTPDQPCDIGAFSLGSDTVAFVADGGGPVASISGPDGSSITLPPDTYPGYGFNGWYAAASGGTEVAGAGASYAIPVGGVTLYAQWSANATDDYSFNAAGGAPTPASASGLDGITITLPGAPTLSGYAFAGWNDGTTTYGAGANYTLSSGGSPIVFTAQWGANATDDYSFNTAGGSPSPNSGSGLDGTTITLPAAPTLAGYTFAGWEATTPAVSSGEMAPPAGYTTSQMYFDDQFAGTSLNTSNWTPELAPGGPWDDEGLGAPYTSGGPYQAAYWGPAQVTVDNGVTLTARHTTSSDVGYSKGFKWVSGVITSNFTLPSSGWYVQIRAQMPDTSDGMWPALWFLPSNSDQEFDGFEGGWTGNANEQGHSDLFLASGQQQEVWSTGGTDITSGYNTYGFQYIPGKSVTIYFNGKQAYQVSSSSVLSEAYYMLLELQVASSSSSGWHTALSTSTPSPSNMNISEVQVYSYQAYSYNGAGASYTLSSGGSPIVFTAEWTANTTDDYSFNTGGGTPTPGAGSGIDGTTVTLPGAPTRAGYTFAGWSSGATTYSAGATYTLSSGGTAIVFTAQWTTTPTDAYSFNTAGGAPTPTSGSGLDGTTITLPGAPTRTGYTFGGWNNGTSTYGAGATYTLSSGGTAIVFTAQWTANPTDAYSFNAAGGAPTPTSGSGLNGTTITLPSAPTGRATPSVAGATARPPTAPAPRTRSRAGARPSSSPPSGARSLSTPTASTWRAARRLRRRARDSTAPPSPCRARRLGRATPSVAGATGRAPTAPAPPTPSRAGARPSSSPPSGPSTRWRRRRRLASPCRRPRSPTELSPPTPSPLPSPAKPVTAIRRGPSPSPTPRPRCAAPSSPRRAATARRPSARSPSPSSRWVLTATWSPPTRRPPPRRRPMPASPTARRDPPRPRAFR